MSQKSTCASAASETDLLGNRADDRHDCSANGHLLCYDYVTDIVIEDIMAFFEHQTSRLAWFRILWEPSFARAQHQTILFS